MKRIYIFATAFLLLAACSNSTKESKEKSNNNQANEISQENKTSSAGRIFNVKSGYIKYNNQAAGMEMTREFWFDNYGTLQYEENYMVMMGQKTGGSALVRDGYRYTWSYNTTEGSKMKFYSAPYTEFEKVSKDDIERYKMKDLGFETIAGKKCRKVSVEKPVETITWTWEGIPIKTVTKFGGKDIAMEAVTITEEDIPATRFDIPEGITFKDM